MNGWRINIQGRSNDQIILLGKVIFFINFYFSYISSNFSCSFIAETRNQFLRLARQSSPGVSCPLNYGVDFPDKIFRLSRWR